MHVSMDVCVCVCVQAQQLPVLSSLDRRRRGNQRGGRTKVISPPPKPRKSPGSRTGVAEANIPKKAGLAGSKVGRVNMKAESGVNKAESAARRRSITMRLATSESRVVK